LGVAGSISLSFPLAAFLVFHKLVTADFKGFHTGDIKREPDHTPFSVAIVYKIPIEGSSFLHPPLSLFYHGL
jgi:hypothetical protein